LTIPEHPCPFRSAPISAGVSRHAIREVRWGNHPTHRPLVPLVCRVRLLRVRLRSPRSRGCRCLGASPHRGIGLGGRKQDGDEPAAGSQRASRTCRSLLRAVVPAGKQDHGSQQPWRECAGTQARGRQQIRGSAVAGVIEMGGRLRRGPPNPRSDEIGSPVACVVGRNRRQRPPHAPPPVARSIASRPCGGSPC